MVNKMSSIKKWFNKLSKSYQEKLLLAISTASGVLIALVWRDTLQKIIDALIPVDGTLKGQVIYALAVTAIVVLMNVILTRMMKK